MKIDINANSLRKLVRLLRNLADELERICKLDKGPDMATDKVVRKLKLVSGEDSSVQAIVSYYKEIHPTRGRAINSKHKDWKLIKSRLSQGYTESELKTAILENSKRQWWVEHNLHGIQNIMGKDQHLDSFIQENKRGTKNGETGYSPGSAEFSGDFKGFGD